MSKKSRKEPDPFADIREWQDHMYDPGYFTGGRLPPLLKARRPNRHGWVLIVSSLFSAFFAADFLRSGDIGPALYVIFVAAVFLVAGVMLVGKRPSKKVNERSR
jgi:hypothetical protein